ncbi:MAG: riboflavin synthase [Ignavibacteriales bacterium]|nr:riboflavin synthase [Ignavibacteriales bacterium]
MFTGLVEETGTVRTVRRKGGSVVFSIYGEKTGGSLKRNESISVEGVCLTVTEARGKTFSVQAVEETLEKTTLGGLRAGDAVNLERPLLPASRLGGHFVLGHVDGLGTVKKIEWLKSSWVFWIQVAGKFRRFLIPVGSVAVNGVSLTVAKLGRNQFAVSIIPHTRAVTTFKTIKVGDKVNVEFDVLGKYVDQIGRLRKRQS